MTNLLALLLIIGVGCPIILPRENESVLLGAAILGAVAAKRYSSLIEAMKALNAPGKVCHMHGNPFFILYIYVYILQQMRRQKFV